MAKGQGPSLLHQILPSQLSIPPPAATPPPIVKALYHPANKFHPVRPSVKNIPYTLRHMLDRLLVGPGYVPPAVGAPVPRMPGPTPELSAAPCPSWASVPRERLPMDVKPIWEIFHLRIGLHRFGPVIERPPTTSGRPRCVAPPFNRSPWLVDIPVPRSRP